MRLVETSPKNLFDRVERATAKFARIARCDAMYGGAKALRLIDRLERMGSRNTYEYRDAITGAYHSSTGNAREHLAFECPECGCACLGESAAYSHCHEDQDCND